MLVHIKKASLLLCIGLAWSSCTYNEPEDPNTFVPSTNQRAEQATHTIAQLKAFYSGGPTKVSQGVYVEGIIISDDTEGNLYKSAYISDETGGIELKFGMGNMSAIYPQGSKVILHASAMTLGKYGGQINLGNASTDPRYETGFYPEKLVEKAMIRIGSAMVTPQTASISTLRASQSGTLVRIDGVQFQQSELGQTYADPTKATLNVNRTIVDKTGATLIVRTSSYAKFAGTKLPTGSGSIVGILTYFNTTPQLLILRERDVQLSGERF